MRSERYVIVTGGSTGIGDSICETLLTGGYTVLNLSLEESARKHERLVDFPVDLSDVDATRQVVSKITNEYPVTGLVHNAGVIRPDLIEDVDLDDVAYVTRLHLYATVTMMQGVLDAMKDAHFGRVVIISSRAVLGLQTRTGYSATKAAQLALARTWALELGEHGITVNVIAPGPVVTEMFTQVMPEDSDKARKLAQSIPVRRLGRPEDIANAVQFFLSPDSGFITGQCLYVCGGTSVGSLAL